MSLGPGPRKSLGTSSPWWSWRGHLATDRHFSCVCPEIGAWTHTALYSLLCVHSNNFQMYRYRCCTVCQASAWNMSWSVFPGYDPDNPLQIRWFIPGSGAVRGTRYTAEFILYIFTRKQHMMISIWVLVCPAPAWGEEAGLVTVFFFWAWTWPRHSVTSVSHPLHHYYQLSCLSQLSVARYQEKSSKFNVNICVEFEKCPTSCLCFSVKFEMYVCMYDLISYISKSKIWKKESPPPSLMIHDGYLMDEV